LSLRPDYQDLIQPELEHHCITETNRIFVADLIVDLSNGGNSLQLENLKDFSDKSNEINSLFRGLDNCPKTFAI
jgi:hypothetical protein